ncbi:MAG: helix-turn-helix domain-containing protein [Oscillospiraceae bacterium]
MVDKLKQLWYYSISPQSGQASGGDTMNHKELKSKVLGKFFSITAFAEAIGWSRNKASRIINGMQEPSCDDIVDLTNVLDLGEKEFFAIFFDKLSTMCTD